MPAKLRVTLIKSTISHNRAQPRRPCARSACTGSVRPSRSPTTRRPAAWSARSASWSSVEELRRGRPSRVQGEGMKLHDLRPARRLAHAPRTRVGRGIAAGQGKTAGRGTKGQKARAGGSIPAWFEGGQTPLHIRIPKLRGFKNRFKIEYEVVNVGRIVELAELGAFASGESGPSRRRREAGQGRSDHGQPGAARGRPASSARSTSRSRSSARAMSSAPVRRRRRVQRERRAPRSRRPAARSRCSRSRPGSCRRSAIEPAAEATPERPAGSRPRRSRRGPPRPPPSRPTGAGRDATAAEAPRPAGPRPTRTPARPPPRSPRARPRLPTRPTTPPTPSRRAPPQAKPPLQPRPRSPEAGQGDDGTEPAKAARPRPRHQPPTWPRPTRPPPPSSDDAAASEDA